MPCNVYLSKCAGVEILGSHRFGVNFQFSTLKIVESTLKRVIQTTTLEWIPLL